MHQRLTDARRLASIRSDVAAIETASWTRVESDDAGFVEVTGPFGERFVLLRFDPISSAAERQLVADCVDHVRFLLSLVDRAILQMKGSPAPRQREPKDYAAECAMKCAEPAFRVFLEQEHGLERPLTDERGAQKGRGRLGVRSRRELNDGEGAGAAWQQLRGEYDVWRRAGG